MSVACGPPEPAPGRDYYLGTFLLTLGSWEAAERFLIDATLESPNHYETSNNLGALYFRQKRWEEALTFPAE